MSERILRPYPRGVVETVRFRFCRWLGPRIAMIGWSISLWGATNEELQKWGEDAKAAGLRGFGD